MMYKCNEIGVTVLTRKTDDEIQKAISHWLSAQNSNRTVIKSIEVVVTPLTYPKIGPELRYTAVIQYVTPGI